MKHVPVILTTLCAVLSLAAVARSQPASSAVVFDDYGFLHPLYTSARASALGGAYVSGGDDVHSLVFNPAGLARVKRVEVSLGFHQEHVEVESRFFGSATAVDNNDGGLEALAVAFPLPTYRGSLVAAFGIHRAFSGYVDLHYAGTNTANSSKQDTEDNYLLQQVGSLYSYDLGIGIDLSPTLAGGVSAFVIDGTIDVLEQYDYTFVDADPKSSVFVTNEQSVEVDGFGARVGLQMYFHPLLSVGVSVQTPTLLNANGDLSSEVSENVDNGIDTFSSTVGVVDIDYVLPFRVDFGVSGTSHGVTASVEMGYADWSEASIDRRRLRAQTSLETVFKQTIDFRAGVEWTVPVYPLRLRAGYAHRPYPLRFLQGDRIDREEFDKATMDDDRHQWSFGVGGLVGNVMTIDAAFVHIDGQRSVPNLVDSRAARRVLVSASYRY